MLGRQLHLNRCKLRVDFQISAFLAILLRLKRRKGGLASSQQLINK
jgi:hypothetical protein